MKKITLSIVLFFLFLFPRLTCAEEIPLPLGLEWGSSPETVFSILKNKCKPTYDKENRSIGCLILGQEIYDTYLIYCKFDKDDKLKYINKSVYVFGDGSYKENMSAANIYETNFSFSSRKRNGSRIYGRGKRKRYSSPVIFEHLNYDGYSTW